MFYRQNDFQTQLLMTHLMLTNEHIQFIQKRTLSYAFKLKKLKAFQEESLEDLQHDLWADVLKALESYDPQKGIWSHFVENVLRKRYCDFLRQRFRFKHSTYLQKFSFEDVQDIDIPVQKTDIETIHDQMTLQKHLRKMPRPMRTVFEQARMYSFRQIAKNLGLSRHDLQKLVQQGKAYLQFLQEWAAPSSFLGRLPCAFR